MIAPVVLWTDALVFALVAVVAAFALHARRREHLREPWRRVLRSPMGVASGTVLGAFVLVGLLDSLHFHPPLAAHAGDPQPAGYSTDVVSVFDRLVWPLRERVETTYSAPFATHAYTRETLDPGDGRQVREYPRLRYGGAHLADPQARGADIAGRAAAGLAGGLAAWLALALGLTAVRARRRGERFGRVWSALWGEREHGPRRTFLLTLGVLLVLVALGVSLAGAYHVLGTDKVGQDVLYQALKSVRTGLVIGTVSTLVMLPFAIALGISAGYFRGWVDDLVQYLYTTLSSIPGVLLIAAAILMLQVYMANHPDDFESLAARADLRLLFLSIILGVTSWTGLARLLRAETLKLSQVEFVQAAQAFGVSSGRILGRHVLPNVMHIVLITVVLDFSGLVLAEAVLSYVSIGVDPATISWGNMINSARLELAREPVVWWSLAAAFLFMFALVLSANLFADVVRDAFDPRLRGSERPA
ncbi:MAG: ABC transporter permease [Gammaproteobacteria bacterium]|jgi:peptide/nickel transport system permease protein|nr:ABC transporter permease [Gammaproteobacteria bacterium]